MEYVNDINVQEAIIHILDSNGEEPVINQYLLDLNEEIYKFVYKHVEKCMKDEELKYAIFNKEGSLVKEVSKNYLNDKVDNLVKMSQKLATELFKIMKANPNIPSSDLLVVSIATDQGPMVGILKLDYVQNFVHQVEFVEDKIGIGIVPQAVGLPGMGQRIQKAAFIKPISEDNTFDLMVIDKQKKSKDEEDYGIDFFNKDYLGCYYITNARDMTKTLMQATEKWTRNNIKEDADKAERIRTTIKSKLKEEDAINIEALSQELFKEEPEAKEEFKTFVQGHGLESEVTVDKAYVEKKLKRVRLKVDKEIDLYIDSEAYHDDTKFEIQRNGDGSINMIIKHVTNYIEK